MRYRHNKLKRCTFACKRNAGLFTLVELLVVCALVVIVLAAVGAFFDTLGGKAKVRSGVRVVRSQLNLARQLASTKRHHMAVIMPGDHNGLKASDKYAVLRIAAVEPCDAGCTSGCDYRFARWLDASSWKFLRSGITIMESDSDPGIQDADGWPREPEENGATRICAVPLDRLGASGSVDNVRGVVFSSSGRVLGTADSVTVGDAVYTKNGWVIKNPADLPKNKSSANQATIRINNFSGNTSVVWPEDY